VKEARQFSNFENDSLPEAKSWAMLMVAYQMTEGEIRFHLTL